MATGIAGTGTPLTASGRGSVSEIDAMFEAMWDLYQVSPTVLYVNAQELKNITDRVLSSGSGPLLRFETPADGSSGGYPLTASGVVQFYYNPFAIDGGLRIPISHSPARSPRHHYRLGGKPASAVSVKRGAEYRGNQDAPGLLPNQLAGRHPSAPDRRLCRGGPCSLCAVRDGRDYEYRRRLTGLRADFGQLSVVSGG